MVRLTNQYSAVLLDLVEVLDHSDFLELLDIRVSQEPLAPKEILVLLVLLVLLAHQEPAVLLDLLAVLALQDFLELLVQKEKLDPWD